MIVLYLSGWSALEAKFLSFSNNSLAALRVRRTVQSSRIVSNWPEAATARISDKSSIPEKSIGLGISLAAEVWSRSFWLSSRVRPIGNRAFCAVEEPTEVEVKAERCLQMELHSRVSAPGESEFDSPELEKQNLGLNEDSFGFGGFGFINNRLLLMLSCIAESESRGLNYRYHYGLGFGLRFLTSYY